MNPLPTVAVVILNWNGKSFLERFLPSVLQSAYGNLAVFVADNASTDNSVSFLQNNFPSVRIISNPTNEGFAKGYNTALAQVDANYYILLNSDVEVSKGWISPIISLMEEDTKIAACQPKILSFSDKTRFEYAGAAGGWLDAFGYPFARGRVFDTCETDAGQYDQATEVFWATGAALFVRSSIFHELGGFDEYFFAHQEEIDLCWRMQRAGYKIFVEPASKVFHVGGGTLPMGNKRKVFLNFRNNLVTLSKNLPFSQTIWKIPVRISLDNLAAFRALIAGDFPTFASIESAHFGFLKWILRHKKPGNLPKKKLKGLRGVYRGSIVWNYFIRKKRTFSEILDGK